MHKMYIFNEDRKGFGEQFKGLMRKNNFTIERLAENLDISVETVKKWRAGKRIPDIEMMRIISEKFHITMHQLYLPNSIYERNKSEELLMFLSQRKTAESLSQTGIEEIKSYSDYLFQKALFSFLSPKEKADLKRVLVFFKVTTYGKEKLNINTENVDTFYTKIKDYMQNKYGKKLPYTINEEKARNIYADFEKMVIFNNEGVEKNEL